MGKMPLLVMSQKYGQPGNSDTGPRLTKDWLERLEVDDVTINKNYVS